MSAASSDFLHTSIGREKKRAREREREREREKCQLRLFKADTVLFRME